MKPATIGAWVAAIGLCGGALGERPAQAWSSDTFDSSPPDGWSQLCVGQTIDVKPTMVSRLYTGSGTCWVNVVSDKSDGNHQEWIRSTVTLEGTYALQKNEFAERLTIPVPTGTVIVTRRGTCTDDPWEKRAQCGPSLTNIDLGRALGWMVQPPNGPLSPNVFGPGLISALLAKQASSPPLAPVDVDAVRWPESDGTVGRIFWRAPDVSGNRWILAYEIERASSTDSAFTPAGRVVGPGAKSVLSPNDVSRFFYTPSKLGGGPDYFRVCASNDAGKQCSGAVLARPPTQKELMSMSQHQRVAITALPSAGAPPTPVVTRPMPGAVRPMGPTSH